MSLPAWTPYRICHWSLILVQNWIPVKVYGSYAYMFEWL